MYWYSTHLGGLLCLGLGDMAIKEGEEVVDELVPLGSIYRFTA